MKVLLVDDQPRILEATRKLVNWEKLGVDRVLTAQSAAEAKDILETEAVDIMLTDIEMPGEDGISLQRWQRDNCPEVLCLFLTSHAEFGYAQEALRNGAYDYILQPAAIPDIEKAMERAVKNLAERRNLIELSRNINDTLTQTLNRGMEWGRWIGRGDGQMVRRQIEDILEDARRRGKLTQGMLRRVHHAFVEACDLAAYARKTELDRLLSARGVDCGMFRKRYDDREALLSCVEDGLSAFETGGDGGIQETTLEQRIREVIRYLNENMDRSVPRSEAAKLACLNEDYFSRAFKKETGMGYKEYVLKEKMVYAAKLLTNTELSITTIAAKVGYDNYNHFSQAFRKVMDQTPTDYRKNTKSIQ